MQKYYPIVEMNEKNHLAEIKKIVLVVLSVSSLLLVWLSYTIYSPVSIPF